MTALPVQRRPWRLPVTAAAASVTAAISVIALFDADLSGLLTRDEALLRAGQWWRVLTPILVQPAGWGQFAFNLTGLQQLIGASR